MTDSYHLNQTNTLTSGLKNFNVLRHHLLRTSTSFPLQLLSELLLTAGLWFSALLTLYFERSSFRTLSHTLLSNTLDLTPALHIKVSKPSLSVDPAFSAPSCYFCCMYKIEHLLLEC